MMPGRILLLLVLALACDRETETYVERRPGEDLLLGDFKSYSSLAEVRARLSAYEPHVVEDSPGPTDHRPPFHMVTVEVLRYRNLGRTGTLRLDFFNDRLQSAGFTPATYDDYVMALAQEGVKIASAAHVNGNVTVTGAKDEATATSRGKTNVSPSRSIGGSSATHEPRPNLRLQRAWPAVLPGPECVTIPRYGPRR